MTNLFNQTALWMIPIFMFITAVRLLRPYLKGNNGEMTVAQVLERCCPYVLHQIIIPDAKGGMTRLDHVMLTSEGLLVVETENYQGLIFGTPRERCWIQRLGRSSHRFPNPVWHNQLQVKALQALNLGVPVHGRVVFSDQARFPKGRPPGVSQLSGLQAYLAEQLSGEPGTTLRGAWFHLRRLTGTGRTVKRVRRTTLAENRGEARRSPLAHALLGISLAWMFILWVDASVGLPESVATAATSTNQQNQPFIPHTDQTQTRSHLVRAASTSSSGRIVGNQHGWVVGRSLEECLGPDRRLNSTVLRCRQGYQRRVPVFND